MYTHTFAELEVSPETYREIEGKLRQAGYHHAFVDGAIDMMGIGLIRQPEQKLVVAKVLPMPHTNRGD